jgi:hypothetical protein
MPFIDLVSFSIKSNVASRDVQKSPDCGNLLHTFFLSKLESFGHSHYIILVVETLQQVLMLLITKIYC